MKILEIIANPADATSFYRARGPMAALYKEHSEIDLIPVNSVEIGSLTWADIQLADIVFLQRPHGWHFVVLAEMVKAMKINLWVDYDDYLMGVPEYNPHHKMYDLEGMKASIEAIIELADVVTVTTPELYGLLLGHVPTAYIEIIPNAHNDYLLKDPVEFNEESRIVYWRGSQTHDHDVYSAKNAIREMIAESEAEVHFIGHRFPYFPTEGVHYDPSPGDILDYFRFIRDLKPALCVNPLIKNEFNKGKSNIAWLEATYAGAACWAPRFIPDFDKPGVICYEGEVIAHDSITQIEWEQLSVQHAISWSYITENLLLSKVNEKRWDIVQRLS